MFSNLVPNYLIGLREGLEAALVVSILVAYLVKTGNRARLAPIRAGAAAAVGLSLLVGAALTFTAASLPFQAQEGFGGALSVVAVAFVTWMVFWMRRTARSLRAELQGRLDSALALGSGALALTAFLAVGREGLETAVFLWSAVRATGGSAVGPLAGAALGLASAVTLAWLLYRRAITLNLSRFFTVTGAALIVVAAGVLAYGVHDLQEAGVLPGLDALAFDLRSAVPAASWYGTLLKGVLNLSPDVTWLQLTVYVSYLVPVMLLFLGGLRRRAVLVPASLLALLLALAGCGGAGGGRAGGVAVEASDGACKLAATSLPAGTQRFAVTNAGSQVTEVYVYGEGDRVVGEVENVAPGTSRALTVQLAAGSYQVACKPGMRGSGIRQALTVAGAAAPADQRLAAGVERYQRYVAGQVDDLLVRTGAFVAAVKTGQVARAKALYGPSRVPWERIEPVAESFGDIDPRVDARAGDLEPGQRWTGWHRLERDLWVTGLRPDSGRIADRLEADLRELKARVATVRLTPAQLGNGAKELLDEVATGKVTGEEERYSHLDLADFQANLDGARAAYQALRPVVAERDPALAATLDRRFVAVLGALARHADGDSFVAYDTLSGTQVRALADQVEALSEPLARVTATVVSP